MVRLWENQPPCVWLLRAATWHWVSDTQTCLPFGPAIQLLGIYRTCLPTQEQK